MATTTSATAATETETATTTTTPTTTKKPVCILCFGIASVDYIATVDHIPQPDEKMRSSSLVVSGGGNAANTACALARLASSSESNLQLSVDLATAVGDDANGKTILDGLEAFGVGVEDTIEICGGGTSPFSYVLVTPDQTRTIIHQPSLRDMSLEFCQTQLVQKLKHQFYNAVHFDGRHPQAAVYLAQQCVALNIPYSLDVERPREGLLELLEGASIVICNSKYCDTVSQLLSDDSSQQQEDHIREEAKEEQPQPATPSTATDREIVRRLKQVMHDQAPRAQIVVQTLGAQGCCLVLMKRDKKNHRVKDDDDDDSIIGDADIVLETDDETKTAPVVSHRDGALWCPAWGSCHVVDSTGAGDAFQGGLIAALWAYLAANPQLEQKSQKMTNQALAHAMRIATRVAAKKLEQPGAREGLPCVSDDAILQQEFEALLTRSEDGTK